MRASVVLAFAAGAFALPEYSTAVIPITQISDGQIQAPTAVPSAPAPSAPVVVTSAAPVAPSAPVVVSSAAPVAPSAPAPVIPANSSAVAPVSSAPSYPNSTVVLSTTAAAGASSAASKAPSASAPAGTGAAAVNMVSFGGLAAAVLAFLA